VNDLRAIDAIADLLAEDEYGLWEIVWRLRTLLPNESDEEVRRTARKCLRTLYTQGRILFVRRIGPTGSSTPVDSSEIDSLLADSKSWDEPQKNQIQLLVELADRK